MLRIFQDVAYGRAASDFFRDTLAPAVRASRVFILLCTPLAKQPESEGEDWLKREFETFLERPAPWSVVPCLAAGATPDSIPDWLSARFPRAEFVDLNPVTSGFWRWLPWRRAAAADEVLKILALLHGVSPEQMPILRREDARRRLRAAWGLVGAALTLTLVLSWLVVALARSMDEVRRNLAESLLARGAELYSRRPESARRLQLEALRVAGPSPLREGAPRQEARARRWLGLLGHASPPRVLAHPAPVSAAVWRPGSEEVVTACEDGRGRVFDALGRLRLELAHEDGLTSIACSRDGAFIATASEDHHARIWNATTGAALSPPLVHGERVVAVAFSPDGKYLASAGWDDAVRLWSVPNGEAHGSPLKTSYFATSIAFDGSGALLATGCWGKEAQLYRTTDAEPVRAQPLEHDGIVNALAFVPRFSVSGADSIGPFLVSGCDDGYVRIFEVNSGDEFRPPLGQRDAVNHVAVSPRLGEIASASSGGEVRLWSWWQASDTSISLRHEARVNCVTFDPGGERLASASEDSTARLWTVADGLPLGLPFEHGGPVKTVEFGSEGTALLTSSGDGTARVFDVRHVLPWWATWRDPDNAESPIEALAWRGETGQLAVGNNHGTVALLDVDTGDFQVLTQGDDLGGVERIELSESGDLLLASDGALVRVLSLAGGAPSSGSLPSASLGDEDDPIRVARFVGSSRVLAGHASGVAKLWSLDRPGPPLRVFDPYGERGTSEERGPVRALLLGPDAARVLVVTDSRMACFDGTSGVRMGEPVLLSAEPGPALDWRELSAFLVATKGGELLRIDLDGSISARWQAHDGPIAALAANARAGRIYSAGDDRHLRAWTPEGLRLPGQDRTLADAPFALAVSGDGEVVAVGGLDRGVVMLLAAGLEPIGAPFRHDQTVTALAFDPRGRFLASGGFDGRLKLWKVAPATGGAEDLARAAASESGLSIDSSSPR